jgi:hypothetical protein
MALKSGLAGQLNVGNGMEGAQRWLELVWKATNPDWEKKTDPYKDQTRFPYVYNSATKEIKICGEPKPGRMANSADLESVAAVCAVFLGHRSGDIMLETLCNYIMDHQVPTGYPTNTYYMYYNTLAIFQMGGDRWKRWNTTVRDILVNAQIKGRGCFDGSWDYEENSFHGSETGRVLSTAYCCLSLEVYYRYAQIAAKK